MDKLSGHDLRALLTTVIIVCGVLFWVLITAMTNMVNRQHEWRMAMLDRTTPDIDGGEGSNGVDLETIAVDPVSDVDLSDNGWYPGRPRPIKDNPQG